MSTSPWSTAPAPPPAAVALPPVADRPGEQKVTAPVGDIDGAATPIGGRWGREARLDLLLAEELANDVELLCQLTDRIDRNMASWLPPGRPSSATVRLNVNECGSELASSCWGETDIEVLAVWGDRIVPILVEDKVWSPFQYLQPERYLERATRRCGAAVLVAPGDYLAAHQQDAAKFHGRYSIEALIEWLQRDRATLDTQRRRWRAALLRELIDRPPPTPDDPGTVDFTSFCAEWLASVGSPVQPAERSLRTRGQGWLWFTWPRGLGYKATGWAKKDRAAVDLYLKDHGFTGDLDALARLLDDAPGPEHFSPATDTAGNVVLRFDCDVVAPEEGRPQRGSVRETSVVEALEACVRVGQWVRDNEAKLA